MNEPNDPLEVELRALSPHELSPELRERIASRLSTQLLVQSRWPWVPGRAMALALAGGLIAAAVALAFLVQKRSDRVAHQDPHVVTPRPTVASAFDETLPSLWQYRGALRSPGELDALLDKHAGIAGDANTQVAPIRGFVRSDMTLNTFPGEL